MTSQAVPSPLAQALTTLGSTLDGAGTRLEVVGLVPGFTDPNRHVSRAEARVLVTAADDAGADSVVRALLELQADATHRLEAVPDLLWSALGQRPQVAFIVSVAVESKIPYAPAPLVRHPLETEHVTK